MRQTHSIKATEKAVLDTKEEDGDKTSTEMAGESDSSEAKRV